MESEPITEQPWVMTNQRLTLETTNLRLAIQALRSDLAQAATVAAMALGLGLAVALAVMRLQRGERERD